MLVFTGNGWDKTTPIRTEMVRILMKLDVDDMRVQGEYKRGEFRHKTESRKEKEWDQMCFSIVVEWSQPGTWDDGPADHPLNDEMWIRIGDRLTVLRVQVTGAVSRW